MGPKKVQSELVKTKFTWRFLDAVRGFSLKNPSIEYKADKVKKLLGFELTPNELGCFLSQKNHGKNVLIKIQSLLSLGMIFACALTLKRQCNFYWVT